MQKTVLLITIGVMSMWLEKDQYSKMKKADKSEWKNIPFFEAEKNTPVTNAVNEILPAGFIVKILTHI